MTEKIWISLEGNIGAGKSTFLTTVLPRLPAGIVKIDEPVSIWQATGMLEKSYKEPLSYGFPAQVHFFTTRIAEQQRAIAENPNATMFLSERSPVTDKIFWETNLEMELVPTDLGPIYLDIWQLWQRCVAPFTRPSLIIYLDTPVQTCHQRMTSRHRSEEDGVPLNYLQELDTRHREAFGNGTGALMPDGSIVPVLVVDGLQDFREAAVADRIAADLMNRIDVL